MGCDEYIRRYGLKVISITWSRDSHGLFDFENRLLAREKFQSTESAKLVRIADNCKLEHP